jgi:hypothetical protein
MTEKRTNADARRAALAAKRETFPLLVTELWTACTACGQAIRRNVDIGRPGLYRACCCPGALWRCSPNGWERLPTAGTPGG